MNVEQEEAQKALDQLAREIHGIYGTHAAEGGVKTPKWEELPDRAKAISRDISRLVLSRMQEADSEGRKSAPPAPADETKISQPFTIPLPKSWSVEDAMKLIEGLKPRVDDVLQQISAMKSTSPIGKGLSDALSRVTEKIVIDVLADAPELMSKLRQVVEGELVRFLSGDEKEEV